jgi:hypothetical protein
VEPAVAQRPGSGFFAVFVVGEQDVAGWPMVCAPGKLPLLLYGRNSTWLSRVESSFAFVTPRTGFPWQSGRI